MTDTTQPGVSQPAIDTSSAPTESTFQSLFDAGAFDSEPKKPDPAAATAQGDQSAPEQAPAAEVAPEANEGQEAAAETQAADPEYQSVEDFLTKHSLDADAFRQLPVTVKIDGQTKAVPLADVLKSYQLEGHVNNKSIALSEQQKAFEAERVQAQQYVASQVQTAMQLGQLAQGELMREYQSINWDALKAADPGTWAMRHTEFQQRQSAINGHLQQVAQIQAQGQQQFEQQRQAQLPQEREKLVQYRPEWADSTKFTADQKAMAQTAIKAGFSEAELGQIFDSRYVQILDKAMRFDALQAAQPDVLRKVREAPQMAKPGTRVTRNPATASRQAAQERLARNPRDEDAQAAVFEHLV